jgi:hypothetical protein
VNPKKIGTIINYFQSDLFKSFLGATCKLPRKLTIKILLGEKAKIKFQISYNFQP